NSAVFQFDVPDFPDVDVVIPEIDIPQIDVQVPNVPDFSGMFATHSRHDQKGNDEDEVDRDSDEDEDNQAETDDRGVKVYKMNRQRTIHIPRIHVGGDEGDDWDERDSTAQAKGKGSATMQVQGPVTFQLRAQSGDIEIVTTDRQQIPA